MKTRRPLLALFLSSVIALAGSCTGRDVENPLSSRRLLDLAAGQGLLTCTPVAADSVTQTVGPDGGTIVFGANELVIPAGSLDSSVVITAVAPSDSVNRAQFSPAGLQFQQPASLTMSYANCGVVGALVPRQIAYTTDLLAIIQYLGGVDDILGQTVTGQIHHFSDYVVAW
jgi:hypothetical protein